ncbi:MAG: hypothetical protein QXM92_01550 [Candidatus Anstonellales archaeon]
MGKIPSSTNKINIKLSTGVSPLNRGETIKAPTSADYQAWYRNKDIYQLLSERQKLQKQIRKFSIEPSGYGAYRELQLRQQIAVLDVYLTGQAVTGLSTSILTISGTVVGASAQASYIRSKTTQAIDYSVQSRGQVTINPVVNTSNVNSHRIPSNGFNQRVQKINPTPSTTPNEVSGTQLKILWGSNHSQVVKALEQRLNQLFKIYNC